MRPASRAQYENGQMPPPWVLPAGGWGAPPGGTPMPASLASATASARVWAWSFLKMLDTWLRTVFSPLPS